MIRPASFLATLLAVPAVADGQSRQPSTVLLSGDSMARRFQAEWGCSDAVVAGDTPCLTGVV